jgi:aquaporin Z
MAKRARTQSPSVDVFDRRYVAEFVGTLILVAVGCGTIAISGLAPGAPAGTLSIGLAFGIATAAMVYSIGAVSGAHLNPAVTVAMWAAGRMRSDDVAGYIIAQVLGAIAGAGVVALILWSKTQSINLATANLGQNNFGPGFLGAYPMASALLVEFVATLIFALVILGATSARGGGVVAGLIIGLTYTALHLAFIMVTGLSVNPARSIGPAIWVLGSAIQNVWVFIVAPIVGGLVAGWLHKEKVF